jgi:hypothetical protein
MSFSCSMPEFENRSPKAKTLGVLVVDVDAPWGYEKHNKKHHVSQHWDKKAWSDEDWKGVANNVHRLSCPVSWEMY